MTGAEAFEKYRQATGRSVADLAREAGITRQTIYAVLRGSGGFGRKSGRALARITGIPLETLTRAKGEAA